MTESTLSTLIIRLCIDIVALSLFLVTDHFQYGLRDASIVSTITGLRKLP